VRTTTVTCDKCKEVIQGEELEDGQIFEVWLNLRSPSRMPNNKFAVEVCRPCAIQIGVLTPSKYTNPPESAPDPEPDVWEAIEIVVNMCRERGLLGDES